MSIQIVLAGYMQFAYSSLMEKLRSYLTARNLTITAFALKVGLSDIYLRQVLAGSRTLAPDKAHRIEAATAGEVTLYDIYPKPAKAKARRSRTTP